MIEKITHWYCSNFNNITWFIIGSLCTGAFFNFGKGDYANMIISIILAGANFYFVRKQ